VAQLIVTDGKVDSAPDTVTISTFNSAPVAEAGPNLTAAVGDTVSLDGSGSSDADGDALAFRWSLTRPAGSKAVLMNGDTSYPSCEVDQPGEYMAQLIVHDGELESAPDICTLVVQAETGQPDDIDAILSKMARHRSRFMRNAADRLKDAIEDLKNEDSSEALHDVNRAVRMLQRRAAKRDSDPNVGATLDELMVALTPLLKQATENEIKKALSVAEEGDWKVRRAQRHLRRALRNSAKGTSADTVINDFRRAMRNAEEVQEHEEDDD
jgi:hypothetical protein